MSISTAIEIIGVKAPDIPQDARLTDFVDLAKLIVAAAPLGTKFQYALALLVLHWMKLADMSSGPAGEVDGTMGISGGIRRKKEGMVELEFNRSESLVGSKASERYYGQTVFGFEFYQLWQHCFIGPMNRFT